MKNIRKQIKTVGLIANLDKAARASVVAQRAARLIQRAGRAVCADEATARLAGLKCETFPDTGAVAQAADVLLVFGGDGTMLRVVRDLDGQETPMIGINIGTLGFLTAIPAKEIDSSLQALWKGDYTVESRPLMEATGVCAARPIRMHAFNDIVISHGAVSRLIELDVTVDGENLTRYRGDGLVVCSPSGSTAYSLSAGGPIISPTADVFAITPICAHALSNRSVIVSQRSVVQVKLLSQEMETIVSADGRVAAGFKGGDSIKIFRSRRQVKLLTLASGSFFDAVRRKLRWSGSAV
ncbi:MAG TPA: NAD(+)/NADH kinase [Verrucomicrobiae bacterium]|nr:NAD(+)/NADH kinase [Verrucomicrobiae bacterium]